MAMVVAMVVVVHSTAMAGLKNVCTHRRIAGPVITHGGNTTSASDNDSVCQDAARYGLARGHTCEKQCDGDRGGPHRSVYDHFQAWLT